MEMQSSKNESSRQKFNDDVDEAFVDYEVGDSSDNSKSLGTQFGALHYMVVAAGLSLILFIIYVLYDQTRLNRNQEPQLPQFNTTCEHRFCARVQLSNPSCRCLLETTATNRTCTQTDNLRISTTVENAVVADYSPAYPIDSPPSYIATMHYDYPPTYEEAIQLHFETQQHACHI
ncbi:hypothetical protein FQA39_LY16384 [Lamprigera yunnana]|nr:hypothetical protein FQA39_LY16384 [Lamprigera yunnana]